MAMGPKKRGIWQNARSPGPKNPRDPNLEDRVADFSYSSDALAQLIAEIWTGSHASLLPPNNYANRSAAANTILATRGIHLTEAIVITEAEYDEGFSLADAGLSAANGIVFVLPNQTRAPTGILAPPSLLETAKLLMAVTPNGI
jgi:hypothetical protein